MNDYWANIYSLFVGVSMTLAALLAGNVIDKLGRRSILLAGVGLCVLTLFCLATFHNMRLEQYTRFIILLFIFGFGFSLGPVATIYISEILPEKGITIAVFTNWFFTFLIGMLFPKMVNSDLGTDGSFMIFFCFTTIGFVYFYFNMKETKGLNSDEIKLMFSSDYKQASSMFRYSTLKKDL